MAYPYKRTVLQTEKNNPKHICVNNIHSLEANTYGTYILMVNMLHFAQFQETLWTYSVYKIHHACDILAFRYIWSTPSEMCMQFVVWLCAVVVRVCLVLSIPFSVTTPAPGNHAIGSDRALKNMAKQIIMQLRTKHCFTIELIRFQRIKNMWYGTMVPCL